MKVVLASCAALPNGDGDEDALIDALRRDGVDVVWQPWGEAVDADLVVLRATWDYTERLDDFLAWCETVPALANPLPVVRWNTDKSYLVELAGRGIPDIRLPYPLNPVNADRVLSLLDRTHLSFVVDDLDVARGWSRVMSTARRQVDVLIKIDVGFHRCGIDPALTDAADFIARVADLPGLRLKGRLPASDTDVRSQGNTSASSPARLERRFFYDLNAAVPNRER